MLYGSLVATTYHCERLVCVHATLSCSSICLPTWTAVGRFRVLSSTQIPGTQLYWSAIHALSSASPLLLHLSCFSFPVVSFFLLSFCSFSLLYFACSFAFSSPSLNLCSFLSLASFPLLLCSRFFCSALSIALFFSIVLSCFSLCLSLLSIFSFLFSLFRLYFSPLLFLGFKDRLSFTMPSSSPEYSIDCCVSVGQPSSTRLCIIYYRQVHDSCDAGVRFAPMEVAELSLS